MVKLRQKALTVMAGMAVLLGTYHHAQGQRMRRPRVYNPRTYHSTRSQMNNRAAARAAIKKGHKAKARGRRPPRRGTG